jgi:hypothetical protein
MQKPERPNAEARAVARRNIQLDSYALANAPASALR